MSKQSRKRYHSKMDQRRRKSILATAYKISEEERLRDEAKIKQAMHKWGLKQEITNK